MLYNIFYWKNDKNFSLDLLEKDDGDFAKVCGEYISQ